MAILTVQAVVTDHHKCRICSSICKRRAGSAPGNSTLVQIHHPSTPAGLQLPPYQRSIHSNPLLQTLQHNLALVQHTVLHKLHTHFCVKKSSRGSPSSSSRRGRKVAACLREQQKRRGLSLSIRDVRGRSSGSATHDVRNNHRPSAPPLVDVLALEGGGNRSSGDGGRRRGSGDSGVSSCADRVRRHARATRRDSDAESSRRASGSQSYSGNNVGSSSRKISDTGSSVSCLSRKISDTGSSVSSSSRKISDTGSSVSSSSRKISDTGSSVSGSSGRIGNASRSVSCSSRKISDTGSSVSSSSRKISDTGSSVSSSSRKISDTGSSVSSSSGRIGNASRSVSCSSRKISDTGSSVSSSSGRIGNASRSVSCSSRKISDTGSSVSSSSGRVCNAVSSASSSSRRSSNAGSSVSDTDSTNTTTKSGHSSPLNQRRKRRLRSRIKNRFLGCRDGISISVWNRRKIHKKASGAAFLGSVLLTPTLISQLRDTGYQQLELGRSNSNGGSGGSNGGGPSEDPLQGTGDVRGQLVVSLMTRDNRATSSGGGTQHGGGGGGGTTLTLTNTALLRGPDDLPEGWEERRSANGRVYYVDHNSRTTHWERPRNSTASPHLLPNSSGSSSSSSGGAGNKLVSSPKRYSTCFTGNIVLSNPSAALMASGAQQTTNTGAGGSATPERTPTRRARSETVSGSSGGGDRRSALVLPLTPTHDPDTPNNNTLATTPSAGADSSQRRRSARHRNYLTRNRLHDQPGDLPAHYELRTTQQGQVYYYNTESGTSTWHDPRIPRDLGSAQHDSQLLGPLPAGWELRETASGRPYFLNHIKRTTQFTDPRLSNRNVLNNILRNRESNNSLSSSVDSSNTTTITSSTTDNDVDVSTAPSTVITNILTSSTSTPPLTVNSHSSNAVVNSTGQNGVGSGGTSRAGSGANSRAGSPEAAIPPALGVTVPLTASSATASRPGSAITSRQSSSNSITAVPATAAPSSNSIVSLSSRLAAALSFGESINSSDNINGGSSSNLISSSNNSATFTNGSLGEATPTNSDRIRVLDNNARNEDNSSSTPTPDIAIRPRINNVSTPSSPLITAVATPTAAATASTGTPVRAPVRIPPQVSTTNITSTTTSSSAITTVTPTTPSGGSSSSTTTSTTTTTTSSSSSSVLPSSTVSGGGGTKEGAPLIETEGDCLPKYTRDLVAKLNVLRAQLVCQVPQSGHCRLDVPRNEVFEESFRQISKLRPKDLKKRLMVKFRGEEGLDYGGVAREWLYLLSHEMLNPYYGLFQYSRDDIYTLQINPDSNVNPEHLAYFFFVGRVIGMAVFHGHYIDGGFAMPFYKMLLNKPIVLQDIEAVDPELYNSLNWILENDITDVLESQSFTVERDRFGALQRRELKPGGASLYLSESNKKEYVQLYVKFRFMQGIERQFSALQKGFTEVVSQELLAPFDERELELIIGGLGKIDVEDWKANTRLKHCTADTPVVVWFWEIVQRYSEEMRARLLQFVTGSSRVPLQGFKALQGSTGAAGPRLFTIHLIDANKENLPKAHTCFNRIDIPAYESYIKMNEKLTQAVEETCGFAVE